MVSRPARPARCARRALGAATLCAAWLLQAGCAHRSPDALALFDAAGRPADPAALLARLRSARFVLLGEVHDNPAQHAARAALLRDLLADGRPSRVVFEQIDREHNPALAAWAALSPASARDAEAVAAAGQLDRAGWRWPLHRPLFEAALSGGAGVVGGNLSRADASALVRGGVAQVPADLRRWFDPARPEAAWAAVQAEALRSAVDSGHCHALPDSMLAPMALAQRARDAALAGAMLGAPPADRVVLIAGNGHVRADIGVPQYLRATGVAAAEIVAIAFVEQEPAEIEARAAPDAVAAGVPGVDYLGVAPAVARPDPCAAFKPKPG